MHEKGKNKLNLAREAQLDCRLLPASTYSMEPIPMGVSEPLKSVAAVKNGILIYVYVRDFYKPKIIL